MRSVSYAVDSGDDPGASNPAYEKRPTRRAAYVALFGVIMKSGSVGVGGGVGTGSGCFAFLNKFTVAVLVRSRGNARSLKLSAQMRPHRNERQTHRISDSNS